MPEYFLPPDVYFCSRGDALIFLNLPADDYVLVSGECATTIRALSTSATVDRSQLSGLRDLLDNGLLTTDKKVGRLLAATRVERALDRLFEPDELPVIRVNALDVYRFVAACATTAIQLRTRALSRIIQRIETRKRRHRSAPRPVHMDKARELTAVFHRLRWLFPKKYICLYDSLALVEFLSRYGIFPTLVFGVSLEPWAAHCWVQDRGFTFNEGVEEAANYTPVMAI